jgi:predicted ATPase
VDTTGERFYEAELHRLNQQSPENHTAAASCFQQAIAIAQSQSAKSWELRAATSLAKLWQNQGKRQEAYDLLAPVYNWFTEGFDTADLKDTKALLDALS